MKALSALANGAWLATSLPAWLRFRHALRRPESVQWEILRRALADHADTAYGRAHGFREIRTYRQFCGQVPVVDYDALAPWVTRVRQGERSVLTRDPVTRLVPTSGSSGGRKLIPFTARLQSEFNAAIAPWMVDLCREHPAVAFGPAYWSISPDLPSAPSEPSAVPIGFDDDSAYLGGFRQKLVQATLAVPSALRLVADAETHRYLTLLCLLRQPELRLISVWHPSFLTLLLDRLPPFWDELLRDVEQGGCSRGASLPPEVQRAVAAPPQRRRARALQRIGPKNCQAIWPKLRVVSCWGDAQAALPLADLQARLPSVRLQPKGLLATEGVITIPFHGAHPIALTSHFYEFADARGTICRAHELQPGEIYTVILTTAGGLWRYRLDDQVEVDGRLEATPSLRFLGRGGKVSDLCGEKLHENFVARAIAAACAQTRCAPSFAMLAPELLENGRPRYVLFVEKPVPAALTALLEDQLRENPHYALCRKLGQLTPLVCAPLERGAYEIFCQTSIAAGRTQGQIKPEALSLRTDWRQRFGLNCQRDG